MLNAEHVEFAYRRDRPVLRAVSMAAPAGAVTAVVGPNGAGKSTLLRLLLGLARPTSGRVLLEGADVTGIPHADRARRLGYIPQRGSVAFAFSVREVVRLGLYAAHSGGDGMASVDAALERVGLRDRADDPFGALSAGQQQRATIARVLAQLEASSGPRALLADEPVAALDPRHAVETMALLRGLARDGLAVVVVLHDLMLAARWADAAVLLSADGRVAAAGPPAEVLGPGTLPSVFGVEFERLTSGAGEPVLVPGRPTI